MAAKAEDFLGRWSVKLSSSKEVFIGDSVVIRLEKDQVMIDYKGQSQPAHFFDGMLHTNFHNPETNSLFRVIIAYYQQTWNGARWRSIFCLTVDTDPNDAGVWGAEDVDNP